MIDDLVKRLRTSKLRVMSDAYYLLHDAADRIEALETALREIADQCVQDISHPVRTYLALDLARAALGEKKDG